MPKPLILKGIKIFPNVRVSPLKMLFFKYILELQVTQSLLFLELEQFYSYCNSTQQVEGPASRKEAMKIAGHEMLGNRHPISFRVPKGRLKSKGCRQSQSFSGYRNTGIALVFRIESYISKTVRRGSLLSPSLAPYNPLR